WRKTSGCAWSGGEDWASRRVSKAHRSRQARIVGIVHWRLRAQYVTRPRRCSRAIAWSRSAAKGMADPPPAMRLAGYRVGRVDPASPFCTAKRQPRKAGNAAADGAEKPHAPWREGTSVVAGACAYFSRTKLPTERRISSWTQANDTPKNTPKPDSAAAAQHR